jgi:hypothetical protein
MLEHPACEAACAEQVRTHAGMPAVPIGAADEAVVDWAATYPARKIAKANEDFMMLGECEMSCTTLVESTLGFYMGAENHSAGFLPFEFQTGQHPI